MQEQESSLTRTLNLLGTVVGLIYLLWAMWTLMVPATARQEWKLRAALWCARVTSRLGHHAAGASLAREATTGQQNYQVPYALMVASNRLMAVYERMLP